MIFMIMKKNVKTLCIFASLLTIGFAATSCDAPSKSESITEVLDIVAFNDYPYADVTQGHWYKQNGEDVFQKYIPNTQAPFVLYVKPLNEDGVKTLNSMVHISNAYVSTIQNQGNGGYIVTSRMYFESPLFYVSNGYRVSETPESNGYPIYILPQITVKMKEGMDIASIAEKYKDFMSPIETGSISATFDCKLDNAYDILKLTSMIYQEDDVDWAEANTFGGSSTH